MIKIQITSDLHGHLPIIKEEFDLLLICGDICPAHDHYYAFQIEWLEYDFILWIKTLPFKDDNAKVVMTWGNHDFVGENMTNETKNELIKLADNRLIILNFEEYIYKYLDENEGIIKELKIFGTPYCETFGNWAFMRDLDKLEKIYDCMPEDIDILMTHDAPTLGNLGLIQEGRNAGTMAGNKALDNIIMKRKPKYVFCGHIHTGNHEMVDIEGINMCNVALINEYYREAFDVLKITI